MLRFDHVALSYPGGVHALRDVSFDVPAGQFCVVLGASGAGKSTLLRTVNGLATPTAGEVRVDGHALTLAALPALRRRIGMIHQSFNLTPRLSVATNVLTGALPAVPTWRALLGLFPRPLQTRACELIAAVGLTEQHLARRAGELSGGQQQRVAIARAFMLDPAVILADEPVASLDPRISREVLDLLKRQARERGATVLCSLHQVDLARAFADRIVALADGRVAFDGPPDALDGRTLRAVYAAASPAPEHADADRLRRVV
jgi:phosphonate transport system ATP-binding protein